MTPIIKKTSLTLLFFYGIIITVTVSVSHLTALIMKWEKILSLQRRCSTQYTVDHFTPEWVNLTANITGGLRRLCLYFSLTVSSHLHCWAICDCPSPAQP